MFTFTPLAGASASTTASQSLLELDGGVKILIDVGWDERFDSNDLSELERHTSTLSAVLLTHATTAHIGAFAYCCKHFPLFTKVPIYATAPIISLGRTLLQDLYNSTPLACTVVARSALSGNAYNIVPDAKELEQPDFLLQPPTAEEIAFYFSLIQPLKYQQPHQPIGSPFSPSLNGLTITAYNAGHTLGGTIWHIQHGLESIIHAVDWNQARENVIPGAAWLGGTAGGGADVVEPLRKPSALICGTRGTEGAASVGRKKRDELLLERVRATVARGGTVLIPSDSSARVLELTYLLEHAWRKEAQVQASARQGNVDLAQVYLAGSNAGTTIRYARSMMEWMDDSIDKGFEQTDTSRKGGPGVHDQVAESTAAFDLQYVKVIERRKQVERVLSSSPTGERQLGKIIIASDSSLEWGFSRQILQGIASAPRNLVILPSDGGRLLGPETHRSHLAATLYELWKASGKDEAVISMDGKDVDFVQAERIALEGSDLAIYQQHLATQRQLQTNAESTNDSVMAVAGETIEDDDASSSSSSASEESGEARQGKALNVSATLTQANRAKVNLTNEDLGINVLLRRKGIYDFDTRGKKGRERMFPYVVKRRRIDDFGEMIRPEEYLKAEEREDAAGEASQLPQLKGDPGPEKLGQKRKWDSSFGVEPNKASRIEGKDIKGGKSANGDDGTSNEAEESSDDEEDKVDIQMPSKLVLKPAKTELNLQICYIDFDGLHDRRSLQMLIPLIRPRKLILVPGGRGDVTPLANDCRKLLNAHEYGNESHKIDVVVPQIGEAVDASVDTNAWTVKLSESLVKQLNWQKWRSLGVVHVTGVLDAIQQEEDAEVSNKKPKIEDGEKQVEEAGMFAPLLDVLPPALAASTRSTAAPLHVGDLRLADLRKILQATGHAAEFRGEGTLLVDGIVTVRKSGTGRIEVEAGGFNAAAMEAARAKGRDGSFYAVKRKIYEGLAVVAGG